MNRLLILILLLFATLSTKALTYTKEDSIQVVQLLKQARYEADGIRKSGEPIHLWFARQLINVPYVGKTLEVNPKEELAVNLRQLDCTTFVEMAIALALTVKQGSTRFEDYCRNLTKIRYRDGKLDGYTSRNHYFTQWIRSNEKLGVVKEKTGKDAPFTAVQRLDLHYMTKHPNAYPMLCDDKQAQQIIRRLEQAESRQDIRYIPHSQLSGTKKSPLNIIHNGDILAIVTKKEGLDVSHIGFAVWGQDDHLHLLNASQIHKKVILEPMTLHEYMSKHPSQLGVRVIRVND